MKMQEEQSYQDRTAEAESTIRDLVNVARSSTDLAFRSVQKATASGVLHDWIETTDNHGDGPQSYNADRVRLVALINTAMLDA
ncbi:hypothetical protein [Burkholderia gladioli]|uniref:hypothetical protein n=1 Tax=Burkholderia gladioli TaxID=28095 RepID=UPI002FE1808C